MIIAASIKQLLDNYKLAYRVLEHKRVTSLEKAATLLIIPFQNVLTVQVLADTESKILIIHPLNRKIDFARCKENLQRNFRVLPSVEVNRIFSDCEADCWPAIGHPYNVEIIIDKSIRQLAEVYFASGSHTSLLQMQVRDYLYLNPRAKLLDITVEVEVDSLNVSDTNDESGVFASLSFPKLPQIAWQILQLSMRKDQSIKDLIALITQDPTIEQQLKFYTQLPFIQDKLQSSSASQMQVNEVVEHILGFDMVSHIALGVAAGRAFDSQRLDDLEAFWRHAFYAATYAERITEQIAKHLHLDPAISYLAGLFHNFGLLLFSYLFPPEYKLLKKWQQLNPNVPIEDLEKKLLGMGHAFDVVRGGHTQLGDWLLRSWHMPAVICVIAKEHHTVNYTGEYEAYVKIIQLTNQLLRAEGIGDGYLGDNNNLLLDYLGLTIEQVERIIQQIKQGTDSLDKMARSLTHL